MICHDSFTNASGLDMADPGIARVFPRRFNGLDNSLIIPSFHLVHTERVKSSQITPTSGRRYYFNGSGT